jgi:peptide-methionine (S)-S-oxide reductase
MQFEERSPTIRTSRDLDLKETILIHADFMNSVLTNTTLMFTGDHGGIDRVAQLARVVRAPVCIVGLALVLISCHGESQNPGGKIPMPDSNSSTSEGSASREPPESAETELATFGAGCFWCVEAVFDHLDGVINVQSGYMGGTVLNPTYERVCSGRTGHAEVVQVKFDPKRIAYRKLVDFFWTLHDPTTLNSQGADHGTQYRSAVFYHSDEQKETAEKSRQAADASGAFSRRIVTEITGASEFYVAENYHQDYYRLNKQQPYCQAVIQPKLDKLGFGLEK